MGSNGDHDSRSGRATNGGRRAGDGRDNANSPEPLVAELEELYELYGDAGNLPERWLELARRIAEAYERVSPGDGGGLSPGDDPESG